MIATDDGTIADPRFAASWTGSFDENAESSGWGCSSDEGSIRVDQEGRIDTSIVIFEFRSIWVIIYCTSDRLFAIESLLVSLERYSPLRQFSRHIQVEKSCNNQIQSNTTKRPCGTSCPSKTHPIVYTTITTTGSKNATAATATTTFEFFLARDEATALRALCVAEAVRIVVREGESVGASLEGVVGTARMIFVAR